MRTDHCYDADAIAAHHKMQEILTAAAREYIIHDAPRTGRDHAPMTHAGHLLVRLGQWLQTTAQPPIYQEETV